MSEETKTLCAPLKLWFMFDNHTFERIEVESRERMIEHVQNLFAEDGCGSLFVRDQFGASLNGFVRHGRLLTGGYGLPLSEIKDWVDAVLKEQAFHRLMMG